jgi:nucleoside-diphosphate-sugar epimerase
MVYGPNQRETYKLIPYVALSLLKGEAPKISSGAREVDWIYVDDVAAGFVAAATAPGVEGRTLDLGTGRSATVRQVVDELTNIIRPSAPPVFGSVADRPMEQVRVANVEEAHRRLGWRAEIELSEGLRRTVNWYRENPPR